MASDSKQPVFNELCTFSILHIDNKALGGNQKAAAVVGNLLLGEPVASVIEQLVQMANITGIRQVALFKHIVHAGALAVSQDLMEASDLDLKDSERTEVMQNILKQRIIGKKEKE